MYFRSYPTDVLTGLSIKPRICCGVNVLTIMWMLLTMTMMWILMMRRKKMIWMLLKKRRVMAMEDVDRLA